MLKTEQEVVELVGRETVLKFEFISDNLITFKTQIPFIKSHNLKNYKLTLFYEEAETFFCYDSFANFLDKFQIFELVEISNCCEDTGDVVLYHKKYLKNE